MADNTIYYGINDKKVNQDPDFNNSFLDGDRVDREEQSQKIILRSEIDKAHYKCYHKCIDKYDNNIFPYEKRNCKLLCSRIRTVAELEQHQNKKILIFLNTIN